jgi:hypothetical protein
MLVNGSSIDSALALDTQMAGRKSLSGFGNVRFLPTSQWSFSIVEH